MRAAISASVGTLRSRDPDLVHVLDHLEVADVEARHQRDGDAGLARAAGAAGAVHVDLGRVGRRVADHVGEVADVDAARRHVGRHQEAQLVRLDARPSPARAPPAVRSPEICVGVEALALQVRGHVAHVVLGVAEDDRALGILVLEDARQVRLLLLRGGEHVEVLDLLRRDLVLGERHVDSGRAGRRARASAPSPGSSPRRGTTGASSAGRC